MKIFIYLMLIVFSVTIFGKDSVSLEERDERRVDTEPTKEKIDLLKEENKLFSFDDHSNENVKSKKKITEEELGEARRKGNILREKAGTKSQADFPYLIGKNLTNATFQYQVDEDYYGNNFAENYFIPQGLSKDDDGNLIISMYDKSEVKYPIIVRYDPDYNYILNVYTLYDMDKDSHVGGVATYYSTREFIFVSDDHNIRVYKALTTTDTGYLIHLETFPIGYQNSTISISNDYLWSARYVENNDKYIDKTRYLRGYHITNIGWDISIGLDGDVISNYDIRQPKWKIQGIYCDSDPAIEKRLKFYFVSSGNETYVYQALLVTKDIDINGQIDINEYYWESLFTPFEDDSDNLRELPLGGEGIVKKDNYLWMINEGASDYWCDIWWWYEDEDNIDCARELLVVNPVFDNDNYGIAINMLDEKIGSMQINGSSINDWGYKVAIIFAQNKLGQLYYSIGEFDYENGTNKLYFSEPTVANPVGKQYPGYIYENPKVFVEDIKGIYFMNLNESNNDSDDFYFNNLKIIFDDIKTLSNGEPYTETLLVEKEFGDNNTNFSSGDWESMFFAFDIRYEAVNDTGNKLMFNASSSWSLYNTVFLNLRNCYDLTYSEYDRKVCRKDTLDDMEDYFSTYNNAESLLNTYINRYHDIEYIY